MNIMQRGLLLFSVGVSLTSFVYAGNNAKPQAGTVVSEKSVNCGEQGGHKKSIDLVCQEYVLRTDSTDYHVRQQKPTHLALVPVNTKVDFVIDKDKVKFKIDGKSYEYIVVSEAAIGSSSGPESNAATTQP